MPVEIVVLSGSRRGKRLTLDDREITVGDDKTTEICFDPASDSGARGKIGVLKSSDDGWVLTNRGDGTWFINQTAVSSGQSSRLRSGDVVRLSEEGPDFRFSIITTREFQERDVAAAVTASETSEGMPDAESREVSLPTGSSRAGTLRSGAKWAAPAALVAILACGCALAFWLTGNEAPMAENDSALVEAGQSVVVDVLENDLDDAKDPLEIFELDISRTVGKVAIGSDGTVTYDSAGAFDDLGRGQSAQDRFVYRVRDDNGAQDEAQVSVEVVRSQEYNRLPKPSDDVLSVGAGKSATLSVLANDRDPDGDGLTIARLELEDTKGAATLDSDSVVRYQPPTDFDSLAEGQSATDAFRYVVDDGHGGEGVARVSITISGLASEPTAETHEAKFRNAVVYLVVEVKGRKLPLCSGWAVRSDLVVSTGVHVSVLAERLANGDPVFAAYGDDVPRFVPVEDLIVHPLFDKEDAGGPLSRAHNLGIITLKARLPIHLDTASSATLKKPPTGMKIAVVGYSFAVEPPIKPFNILDPPRLCTTLGTVSDMEVVPGATDNLPLLTLEVDAPGGTEGAPIMNEAGKVIGVVCGPSEDRHAVLCDQLEPLLPKKAGK